VAVHIQQTMEQPLAVQAAAAVAALVVILLVLLE
jgi:hypothetical protein